MARIEIVRSVRLAPEEAWARLTDWERHGDVVPLTRVVVTADGFTARTGLGPVGVDDPMEVVVWRPPYLCRIEKRGRWVLGWAELSVAPTTRGSLVTWREEIRVRGVPRAADRLTRTLARALFARTVDGLLRD